MASLARVIAVEKPMQYSVLRTSLSIVLRMAMILTPSSVELVRIAERVVATDRDQMFDAEPREVRQHLAGEVPRFDCDAAFGTL